MRDLFPQASAVNVRNGDCEVYVGRRCGGYPESPFGNPFHVGWDGDRQEVLLKFLDYWYGPKQKYLRNISAEILFGKRLGCWCKPLPCHADIIAGYVNWKNNV